MIFMEDQNKSNEEDYLNAITKDKKVAKDKKSDDVSKAELKKKEKEEKKKAKKEGKKHEKGLIAAVVILAVLLAVALPGGILFIVALCNSNPFTARAVITEQPAESTVVDDNECESYECDEETVEEIVKKVRDKVERLGSKSITRINGNVVFYKINDDGVLLPFKTSLGIDFSSSSEDADRLNDETRKALVEMDFVEYTKVSAREYYINEKLGSEGIICGFGYGYSSWLVACAGRKMGFDDYDNNYVAGYAPILAEVYKNKTGQTIGPVLGRVSSGLENNTWSDDYEIIYISLNYDANLGFSDYVFYKKFGSSDSEWKYAGRANNTQSGYVFYDCDELDEETIGVFSELSYIPDDYNFGHGITCYNEKTGFGFSLKDL